MDNIRISAEIKVGWADYRTGVQKVERENEIELPVDQAFAGQEAAISFVKGAIRSAVEEFMTKTLDAEAKQEDEK